MWLNKIIILNFFLQMILKPFSHIPRFVSNFPKMLSYANLSSEWDNYEILQKCIYSGFMEISASV
jgi:hypothetical protein